MQSTKYTINIQKVAEQCTDLIGLGNKNNWKFYYDEDCDCLYFTQPKMIKGLEPLTFKQDFSLFIDRNSNIHGMYIEYFNSNLVKHDKRFKDMQKIFDKKSKKNEIEKEHLLEIVSKDILSDILVNYQNQNKIQSMSFI
jgi:hypothetical protein